MPSGVSWVFADGAPSLHTIDAAIRTARLIDRQGSTRSAAHSAYVRDPSGGLFDRNDLIAGERLLLDTGMINEIDGVLFPSIQLNGLASADEDEARRVLLAVALGVSQPAWLTDSGTIFARIPNSIVNLTSEVIPDPEARETFLLAISTTLENNREHVGARGEEFVLAELRHELVSLDRPDLAARVQRVSLYSDLLGYDITAPRIDGSMRRIEVKTTRRDEPATCAFFISRNEAEVGIRDENWSLVMCREFVDGRQIIGWCRGVTLAPYLPSDQAGGRWTEARIELPSHLLLKGTPPAI